MENQRVKKARKFLGSAKALLEHGDYDSCISRSYYALFHAAIARLETLGVKQEKWEHRFSLAEFNKEFIHRRKMFDSGMGKAVYDILDQRKEADYGVEEKSFKKAKRVLDKTERILNSILKEFGNEKP